MPHLEQCQGGEMLDASNQPQSMIGEMEIHNVKINIEVADSRRARKRKMLGPVAGPALSWQSLDDCFRGDPGATDSYS